MPRPIRKLPHNVLTTEEVEAIINQPDITNNIGIRDRAILEVFYSSGIRRREMMKLTIKDVDLKTGILIVVQGKNMKDRYVPINERAIKWLEKYLYQVRPKLDKYAREKALFLTQYGRPFVHGSLSYTMSRYVKETEIAKAGACHIFRHTMATLMLENGAELRYIQEILGHTNVSSTQIYTKVSISKLKEVHARTHPANLEIDEGEDDAE